jgi:hypothetical protein
MLANFSVYLQTKMAIGINQREACGAEGFGLSSRAMSEKYVNIKQ